MPSPRKICYLTGTRADFGLMRSALETIRGTPGLELSLIVTGAHLAPEQGLTARQVEESGLPIAAKVDMLLASDSGASMARGIGVGLIGVTQALEACRPDILLLLGDRGEMLAGAVAAVHMNIPVAHVHGGEVSGTVDESVRHAVTKLAHIHLAATPRSAERIRRLGEDPRRVFCVGAPGLDDILRRAPAARPDICRRYGLSPERPYFLVVEHPVSQEISQSGRQMAATMEAVLGFDAQVVVLEPNSDAGRTAMRDVLRGLNGDGKDCHVHRDIPRDDFLDLMAQAAVLVGNSSSGIIEAASFGVPVVNIGTRQNRRERNANVLDVGHRRGEIEEAVRRALTDRSFLARTARRRNLYGDGKSGARIAKALRSIGLDRRLLYKTISY